MLVRANNAETAVHKSQPLRNCRGLSILATSHRNTIFVESYFIFFTYDIYVHPLSTTCTNDPQPTKYRLTPVGSAFVSEAFLRLRLRHRFNVVWRSLVRRTLRDFYFKSVFFITSDGDVELECGDTEIGIHRITCNPGRITYCIRGKRIT